MRRLTTDSQEPNRSRSAATRQKLIAAAAQTFNEVGYWGTDSNRIARAAGYSPATFYKHFANKREIFLVAYEIRGAAEWKEIRAELDKPGADALRRVIDVILEHHKQRIGLRQSLRALAAIDPIVRAERLERRRQQLGFIAELIGGIRGSQPTPEQCLLAMLAIERTCDAIADGDTETLGLSETALLSGLADQLEDMA